MSNTAHQHEHPHHAHVHETAPMHDPVDPWHDHSHDEQPQHAHAEVGNAKLITGIGLALFLVIVASVIAVYAYYQWYITARLARFEVASSATSPVIQGRQYKQEALIRLQKGGTVNTPAQGDAPAIHYTLSPINDKMNQVAADYAGRRPGQPAGQTPAATPPVTTPKSPEATPAAPVPAATPTTPPANPH